jgi:hypothetical protein
MKTMLPRMTRSNVIQNGPLGRAMDLKCARVTGVKASAPALEAVPSLAAASFTGPDDPGGAAPGLSLTARG